MHPQNKHQYSSLLLYHHTNTSGPMRQPPAQCGRRPWPLTSDRHDWTAEAVLGSWLQAQLMLTQIEQYHRLSSDKNQQHNNTVQTLVTGAITLDQ